jgi:hypothetical protein
MENMDRVPVVAEDEQFTIKPGGSL